MVGLVELDLGAAQSGQAGGGGERQALQFGMRVVDDVDAEMDGVARRLSGARGIAGQRIDYPDLDRVGGVSGAGKNSGQNGDNAARGSVHGFLPLRHQPGWKPYLNEKPARLSIASRRGATLPAAACGERE